MAKQTIVKKIPVTETGPGEHCTMTDGQVYVISQNPNGPKPKFTLWKEVSGGYEKIAVSDGSPIPLHQYIPWTGEARKYCDEQLHIMKEMRKGG